MKLRHLVNNPEPEGTLIARFGGAALIQKPRGAWRLEGGSRSDQLEAREWISLFAHEVVVGEPADGPRTVRA